jgi:hypothetical protein
MSVQDARREWSDYPGAGVIWMSARDGIGLQEG